MSEPQTPHIYVDADGCPVKEEVYRVAGRYGLRITLVANSWMRVPPHDDIELVLVGNDIDAADDHIAEAATLGDIVVTTDIPLASRCLAKGAAALSPNGRIFTPESIGEALATREILASMREHGAMTGGPPPFSARHRSTFLQHLDKLIHAQRKLPR